MASLVIKERRITPFDWLHPSVRHRVVGILVTRPPRGLRPDPRRGIDAAGEVTDGRDLDYASLRARQLDADVRCEWVESNHPSYILYTSGTTGRPKGVQRDTGGHAVALARLDRIRLRREAGRDVHRDLGYRVGGRHSYIAYGPLLNGTATVVYEGLPIRPDPVDNMSAKFGSPSFSAYGYDVRLLHEWTGKELATNEKGVACIVPPLPPGKILRRSIKAIAEGSNPGDLMQRQ